MLLDKLHSRQQPHLPVYRILFGEKGFLLVFLKWSYLENLYILQGGDI